MLMGLSFFSFFLFLLFLYTCDLRQSLLFDDEILLIELIRFLTLPLLAFDEGKLI